MVKRANDSKIGDSVLYGKYAGSELKFEEVEIT
jgi:co-chaperonin GroES (HSP10)